VALIQFCVALFSCLAVASFLAQWQLARSPCVDPRTPLLCPRLHALD